MERVASRAQTVIADVVLAAIAFALAYLLSPARPDIAWASPPATFFQLTALYAAIAGGFAFLFRRELSPWRYVSISDVLVRVACRIWVPAGLRQ